MVDSVAPVSVYGVSMPRLVNYLCKSIALLSSPSVEAHWKAHVSTTVVALWRDWARRCGGIADYDGDKVVKLLLVHEARCFKATRRSLTIIIYRATRVTAGSNNGQQVGGRKIYRFANAICFRKCGTASFDRSAFIHWPNRVDDMDTSEIWK